MSLFDAQALVDAPVNTILDEGRYSGKLLKAKPVTSGTGTPGIELEAEVTVGPIQKNQADPAGRHAFGSIWKSQDPSKQKAFFSQVHALADAFHIDLAQFVGMPAEEFTAMFLESIVGKDFGFVIVHEKYNGKNRAKIDGFFPL